MSNSHDLHERWKDKTERSYYNPDQRWENQCLHCAFYVPLTQQAGLDWGACKNEESEWDAKVRFEHDGCTKWVNNPDDE